MRRLAPLLIAVVALLLPASATAAFHEILVREVYPGGAGNDSYVVLQAYSGGQNFVSTHSVTAYDAAGNQVGSYTFSGSVSNGQNQMTILVADSAYATTFPSGPAPDGTTANLDLSPAGGAACWAGLDCVSWGNFNGLTSPPSGTPAFAGGVPAGKALRRTIAPGCSTLLEFADDSSISANDFFEATPNPRANSTAIAEAMCAAAPNTSIGTKPPTRTNSEEATFTFTASPAAGATFECKLDAEPAFTTCATPKTYTGLAGGAGTSHTFQVRAVHSVNGTDLSPASYSWTVDTVGPVVTIENAPPDPSPGASSAFTFKANEAVSGFQCSLAKGAASDSFSSCTSGKTYANLAPDTYTFKVRATDTAGNQGGTDAHTWVVEESAADITPPETSILTSPPNPSDSSSAAFTYSSNEPGSSFECKLDGAAFASCPNAGVLYQGLANGSHSFQVRAIDEAENTDPSPAGFSWDVAVSNPIQPPPVIPPPPPPVPAIPDTTITAKPGASTKDRTPTFRFRSSLPGSSFACKIDKGAFKACSSPFTTKALPLGSHVLLVRAEAVGSVDPTPARSGFKVVKPKRKRSS